MANKDSEAKRRGGLGVAWVLPRPDGTIAQGDRQHKAAKYPGILAEAAAVTYPTGTLGGKSTGGTDFVIPRVPRGLPPGATTRLRRGTQHLQNSTWSFLSATEEAEDDDVLLLRDSSANSFKRITKEDLGISGGFIPGDPGDDGTDSEKRFEYIEVNNDSPLNSTYETNWDKDDEAAEDPGKVSIWCLNQTQGGSVTYKFGADNVRSGTTFYSQFTLDTEGDMIMMITTLVDDKMIWQVMSNNGAVLG